MDRRELVRDFVTWYGSNHLILNFRKTRKKPNVISLVEEEVELVEDYRYLGVYLDNRLN